MIPTVIRIQPDEKGFSFCLEESEKNYPNPFQLKTLRIKPSDSKFAKLIGPLASPRVQEAGRLLYESLRAHPDVEDAIKTMLANGTGPGAFEPVPLFFRLEASETENLPWEALWMPNENFLALDAGKRCPLGRIAVPFRRLSRIDRTVSPRLRMSVILAAAGINASDEWEQIELAIAGLGPDIEVQVFVSEDDLAEKLEAKRATGGFPGKVHVSIVGDTAGDLINQIQVFGPNLVHFFCHGEANPTPVLKLESLADRVRDCNESSLVIEMKELSQAVRLDTVWLVTLNCCYGSKVPEGIKGVNSIAKDLVLRGLPAAVAMREPVEDRDANRFTGAFYSGLLPNLQRYLGGKGGWVFRSMWAEALYDPRHSLLKPRLSGRASSEAAACCGEWTVPVIYVNQADLLLVPTGVEQALSDAEIVMHRAALCTLREGWTLLEQDRKTPPGKLIELQKEICAIEAKLYQPVAGMVKPA